MSAPADQPISSPRSLDRTLVQWMAVQALQDRHARLVEGGADADAAKIDLATIFEDLPLQLARRAHPQTDEPELAMPYLLGMSRVEEALPFKRVPRDHTCLRLLLIGGPGSGKSTLTTMLAQVMRMGWVDRQLADLPLELREAWQRTTEAIKSLVEHREWTPAAEMLPLRINLPKLARWLGTHRANTEATLWDYLAAQINIDLEREGISSAAEPEEVRQWIESVDSIYWILDGLDEVPPSAGRKEVLDIVRAAACLSSRSTHGMLVATRPQGYAREFDAELDGVELIPLPKEIALAYAERLLRVWSGQSRQAQLLERLQTLEEEFEKPQVAALLYSPLHTTMAALLVANQGKLPRARCELFNQYFETIFRRELNKPIEHGIHHEDKNVLRALHARAGLTLHVRSQQGEGARSTLRRRELREMLAAWYREQHESEAGIRAKVERIMQFAMDRLVLLLHSSEGEFEFGVRSLQEFFAAEALVDDDELSKVKQRLEAIAANPHWLNVLTLVASRCALGTEKRDRKLGESLVLLCRALNEGRLGGEAAKGCFAGSDLAIRLLEETQDYGPPVLHDPLWEIALEGAASPMRVAIGKLVSTWPGSNAELHRRRVLDIASARLDAGGEDGLDGWVLLSGMLCRDMPEAVALAERHAPTTPEDAQVLIYAIFADEINVPPWVARLIERNLAWFWPLFNLAYRAGKDLPLVFAYSNLLGQFDQDSRIRIESEDGVYRCLIKSIHGDPKWSEMADLVMSAPDNWLPWKRLAAFMAQPSHESLAELLEAIDSETVFKWLKTWRVSLPWPIAACLQCANGYADLAKLASSARVGQLGTVEDWGAAETRWRTFPSVSREELEAAMIGPLPWGQDIASHGVVLGGHAWLEETTDETLSLWAQRYLRLMDEHPEAIARIFPLLESLQWSAGRDDVRLGIAKRLEVSPQAERSLHNLLRLSPNLSGSHAEEWYTLLDVWGRGGKSVGWYIKNCPDEWRARAEANINALVERLRLRPDQWGLLDALLSLLYNVPDADLSALKLPELSQDAGPRAKALHAFFSLFSPDTDPEARASLFKTLVFQEDGKLNDLREPLAQWLSRRTVEPAITEAILLGALQAPPPPLPDLRDSLLSALRAHVHRTATPAFRSQQAWTEHDLPPPCLCEQPALAPSPRLVRIGELSNIRLFKETPLVDAPFPIPSGDRGQWIVIVGENGVGKTTLLRALALALVSPGIGSELLDKRLPFLANGGEGTISFELDSGVHAVSIRRNDADRKEKVEPSSSSTPVRPWVVGYGVRRGNARGERDREPEVGPIGELHTLFDHPPSLHNAVRWLADLDADVLREQRKSGRSGDGRSPSRAGIWKAVTKALDTLLGVKNIQVHLDNIIYVEHHTFGRVRLDALSDGYLTTAGWVIDMIARWVDRQRELDEHVGADLLRQMTGLVLIDEIDLHLHPVWQMKIIDDVRRLFPYLSFVVTTHNPLTLQGARRGEVYVMRRASNGRIELIQKDIQPGHDVDRVLFEQFGVEHTLDKETRGLLERHADMIARGMKPDDPERIHIEAQLGARLGGLGETLSRERTKQQGALRPLTEDERPGLLDDLLRLSNKNG